LRIASSIWQSRYGGRPVKNWKNVRVIVLAPYLIFYRFEPNTNHVDVLRF